MTTAPPFKVLKLDHVVLRVSDETRSIAFYRDILGCAVAHRQDAIGLVHLRAGSALIDLVRLDGPLGGAGGSPPGADGRNVDHFALRIAPFDQEGILAHLAAHGISVLESGVRYGADGDGPSLYIRDPDGNIVELKGSTDET